MGVKTGSAPWIYSYSFFTKYSIIVLMRIKHIFIAKVLRSMRSGILFYVTHAATLRGTKENECGRGTQILQNYRPHLKILGAKQVQY